MIASLYTTKRDGIIIITITASYSNSYQSDEPEDLRSDQVAPGVLYLASPECRESGFILRASNGQFTAARWIERDNVDYPLNLAAVESSTAEDLATRWQEIAADVAF